MPVRKEGAITPSAVENPNGGCSRDANFNANPYISFCNFKIMKANPVLHITIPQPCTQNWDAMDNAGNGRHCSQCNKVVYDFSQMNDDEVLHFFKQQATIPCGRFHNSQFNRDILPAVTRKKLLVTRFNKIAAALFAVLSFKSFSANANNKNVKPVVALDGNYKNNFGKSSDKIVISGTVKDVHARPIEKVIVMLDSVQIATTDAEGKFSVELKSITAESHHLYFSYGDLVTVVRNYHPAMLSTSYDIELYKTENIGTTMGVPVPSDGFKMPDDFPSLSFKTNGYKLYGDNKAMLASVAAKLKLFPAGRITIYTYPEMCGKQYIYPRRLDNIKKYLVEKEGISADRITTNCEVGGGDRNTVDIKSDN
ncbi:MAG: hypothetical protein WDM90_22370 [Ferruginibacter sp.]